MISIDYQSKIPFYEQIAERFKTLILKGVLKPHTQLPSVRSLAVNLSINPNTIQKAYTMLEQQGYIYSAQGRGNFVAESTELIDEQKNSVLEQIEQLFKYGKELGIEREAYTGMLEKIYRGIAYDRN